MSQKYFTQKVSMIVKSTSQDWHDIKQGVNICMNCGIVNELTCITDVRFIKPIAKRKEKKYE